MGVARALGGAIDVVGVVSPQWGAAVALPLFMRVPRPRPVSARDEATMWAARRSMVRVPGAKRGGVDVVVYEWGRGRRTVALAHGWHGRASQFATLVRELTSEGYRVVAFDAPAHGRTAAAGTYIVDWLDVLASLQRRYGSFDAVVGHSFGGLAALVAVAGGLPCERVVTVSAPADGDALLREFQGQLRYREAITPALRERFTRRYFAGEPDALERLSAVRQPLPRSVPLLVVHDRGDARIPVGEAARMADAHPGSHVVVTEGHGHNRILTSDEFLDAVLELVGAPVGVAAAATA